MVNTIFPPADTPIPIPIPGVPVAAASIVTMNRDAEEDIVSPGPAK